MVLRGRAGTTDLALSSLLSLTWALRMLVVQSHISSSSVQDRYLGGIKGELKRREKVTDKGLENKNTRRWRSGSRAGPQERSQARRYSQVHLLQY